MSARYRAEHVGSLLRTPELRAARKRDGVDAATLRALEDREIERVLARQHALGFRCCTDGELRRHGFMSDFADAVDGLDYGSGIARDWQAGQAKMAQRSALPGVVTKKLRQKGRMTEHESRFMLQNCSGDTKITLPSANQFPAICFKKGITDKVYADHSALLWDIVTIIKAEIAALIADGVRYIQIDAPRYSYYIDPKWRSYIQDEMGLNPEAALAETIRADNACLEGLHRDGVTLAMHLCRGNNRSQWYAEGGYDAIAEKLFGELQVDAFLLEYDTARAGSFEPLRFVPRDKTVVLGLVSSKVAELESEAELKRRIDAASRFVPVENLALSPQCGFASNMEGNLLSEDDQWRKLELVVETARPVWGQRIGSETKRRSKNDYRCAWTCIGADRALVVQSKHTFRARLARPRRGECVRRRNPRGGEP